MFRSTRKLFKFCYYVSSLLPVYFMLLVFIPLAKLDENSYDISFQWHITPTKIVYFIIVSIFCISLLSLLKVRNLIEKVKEGSSTLGTTEVVIRAKYNNGFREFILSVILPMVSTFSILDLPIATLSIIIILQVFMYLFYSISSDFLPNIPLALAKGYSIFIANPVISQEKDQENKGPYYILGKTSEIDGLIYTKQKISFISNTDYVNKNVGVIIKNIE